MNPNSKTDADSGAALKNDLTRMCASLADYKRLVIPLLMRLSELSMWAHQR
jgi:hypothetical protein